MGTFALINSAPDGRHVKVFKTADKAIKALAEWMDRDASNFEVGKRYYSDWGNVLTIEERADGMTATTEKRLAAAYDAREMGTLTKAQTALLAKHGW